MTELVTAELGIKIPILIQVGDKKETKENIILIKTVK